jgi:hypothetical protein
MKSISNLFLSLTLFVIALFALSNPAHAQTATYGPITVLSGGTNTIVAATSNAYTRTIDLTDPKIHKLHLEFQGKSNGTNLSDIAFHFRFGTDGTYFATNGIKSFIVPMNGTNMVYYSTNFTVDAEGFAQLWSAYNPNATTHVTNAVLKVGLKE